MTAKEAIIAYIKKFGGYPSYMLMGASDEYILQVVSKALKDGKKLEFEYKADEKY